MREYIAEYNAIEEYKENMDKASVNVEIYLEKKNAVEDDVPRRFCTLNVQNLYLHMYVTNILD